jgi:hypothetical protein
MKKDLKSKLAKYGALASAAATVGVAKGQVLYTDIKDTTINGNNNHYDLDLNQDNIPDFRIIQYVDTGLQGNVNAILLSPFDSIWNRANGEAKNNFNYPFNVTPGSVLGGGSTFNGIGGSNVKGYMAFEVDGISYPNSNWVGPLQNGFLGLQVRIQDSLHFGWCRLDVAADSKSFTVKDFAVQLDAGEDIIVGEELLSVAQNLLENARINVHQRELEVELFEPISEAELTLIDLQGRTIKSAHIKNQATIDLNELPQGLYIVHLKSKGVVRSEKIMLH